ncbi:MAG: DUF3570 domain-containing protein [Kofleriaceae bacterium]
MRASRRAEGEARERSATSGNASERNEAIGDGSARSTRQILCGEVLALGAAIAALCTSSPVYADGSVTLRGAYYKERATRVMQPMLDAMFDAGTRGLVTVHVLVDSITSASASAGAENAEPFTERRYEGGGGYTHEMSIGRAGFEGKYSSEPDYKSLYVGARGELELAQRNTVLGLGAGFSTDTISGGGTQGISQPMLQCDPQSMATALDCKLNTYSLFASASQILSRNAVVAITYDIAVLRGYQSNPYRTVLAESGTPAERHPDERLRQAIAGSLRYYLTPSHTTLIGAYRYYRDDWKVRAHTPELRVVQEVGHTADASLRYRFHSQDGAVFYRDRYGDPTMYDYLSDDVKLDTFTSHTMEAKLGVLGEAFGLNGSWAGARLEGILQYIVQHNRFGNAITAHLAVTVPFEY